MTDRSGAEPTAGVAGRDEAIAAQERAREWRSAGVSLVLSDGEVFRGSAFGATPADGIATGSFVSSTVMSGYQEVISDPINVGNIIVFTYPQIGNVGVNAADEVADPRGCRGVVIRDLSRITSSWRAEEDLDGYLVRHGIPALTGIDTRRLVRHLRDQGPLRGAFGTADPEALLRAARSTDGSGASSSGTGEDRSGTDAG